MLKTRICLVLGAGASQPYGFPTGNELLNLVLRQQPDDWWPLVANAFGTRTASQTHEAFVSALRNAGTQSIDDFVGKQTQFRDYAKALIAFHVATKENSPALIGTAVAADWHRFFIELLVQGANTLDDVANAPLSVVTFNFDRSFEETTIIRLASLYRLPNGEFLATARQRVADAMSRWPLVHVHGSLGSLPGTKIGPFREYKSTLTSDELRGAVENIELLNDADPNSDRFERARMLIREAKVVFFLGFGFHRVNCQRVLPPAWGVDNSTIYATTKGMSSGAIRKAVSHFLPARTLSARDLDSLGLLRELEDVFSD